jgi:hypothetical protein
MSSNMFPLLPPPTTTNPNRYPSASLLKEICEKGTFYYPAYKHYGAENLRTRVICDRCHRDDINACIGYMSYDLCLMCTQKVINTPAKIPEITFQPADSVTYMKVDFYNPPAGVPVSGFPVPNVKKIKIYNSGATMMRASIYEPIIQTNN